MINLADSMSDEFKTNPILGSNSPRFAAELAANRIGFESSPLGCVGSKRSLRALKLEYFDFSRLTLNATYALRLSYNACLSRFQRSQPGFGLKVGVL